MKNNFWEEKTMEEDILNFHEKVINDMELPNWAKIECPDCSKEIPLNGIRKLSLCLNARNLGDISVEYHCAECGIMNTVYFRKCISKIQDFIEYINNKKPEANPVKEEEMYKLKYNNLIDLLTKG